MSNVAKFLIVMNLILAGVFVGFASSYLGQKDHLQEAAELEIKDLKKNLEGTKSELTVVTAKSNQLSAENSNFKAQQTGLETEAKMAKAESQNLNDRLNTMGMQLSHAVKALELQNDTLKAYEGQVTALQDTRTKLTESRDAEKDARVKAEAVQGQLQRQLDDETSAHKASEATLADANRKIQELDAELAAYRTRFPGNMGTVQPAMPPGKVLAVDNAMGIVVVSFGDEDGAKTGYEYIVSRGNQYVATIKITDVQAKKSTGMVLSGLQKSPVQANDTVVNR